VTRRAVIVDDEKEARRRLARLLAEHSNEIEIAGEAADGTSAVETITQLRPDVLFLDIEMPGLDGFGVLDSLPQEEWNRGLRTRRVRASRYREIQPLVKVVRWPVPQPVRRLRFPLHSPRDKTFLAGL